MAIVTQLVRHMDANLIGEVTRRAHDLQDAKVADLHSPAILCEESLDLRGASREHDNSTCPTILQPHATQIIESTIEFPVVGQRGHSHNAQVLQNELAVHLLCLCKVDWLHCSIRRYSQQ